MRQSEQAEHHKISRVSLKSPQANDEIIKGNSSPYYRADNNHFQCDRYVSPPPLETVTGLHLKEKTDKTRSKKLREKRITTNKLRARGSREHQKQVSIVLTTYPRTGVKESIPLSQMVSNHR
ncbi:unnamed protein product [Dovyalis caffra]|uniref:Uncharacterized protein n=1 Tax=Dovyalis caffra TaxID=77055 RepID=A0AAV1R8X7_9ROSI|nr:unnamed protein product [Dovyalis caffra]